MHDPEVYAFLMHHLDAIFRNDIETYHHTTTPDLTLYEWWVTPHRIEGRPFHDFMMMQMAKRQTVFGAAQEGEETETRYDLANLRIQRYGDAAVASYTLLVTTASPHGVVTRAHNETRVMVKIDGVWKVVHVHKSPAWQAPHDPPAWDMM